MTRPRTVSLSLSLCLTVVACSAPTPPDPTERDAATTGADDTAADPAVDDTGRAGDTWGSYAEGFFATYCVSCHDARPRDFTRYDQVSEDAATIRCGVASDVLEGCGEWPPPEQFPIGDGPMPTSEERVRLVAWIDAGLPE